MELLVYPADEVRERATAGVNVMLEREFGNPVLFLCAGGSALSLLDGVREELLGPHVTIGMTDDRYSMDPEVNNFSRMTTTGLYKKVRERGASFIDTRPFAHETCEDLGRRFDGALKKWRSANPLGHVLAILGIGADGHTCGIMPFSGEAKRFHELFEEEDIWAVGYDAGWKHLYPQRVTVTISFLRAQVTEAVGFAVGMAKHFAVKGLMGKGRAFHDAPAFVLREIKKATVYTDQNV